VLARWKAVLHDLCGRFGGAEDGRRFLVLAWSASRTRFWALELVREDIQLTEGLILGVALG
jgi:hypothetical protein